MKWISTRGTSISETYESALLQGLAPDGGLYMPEILPDIYSMHTNATTISQVAQDILNTFFKEEIPKDITSTISQHVFTFPIPLISVGKYRVLELFHGPTQAFKDIGARMMSELMEYTLQKNNRRATILVATSGDTGGAVAHAFGDKKNIRVIILYPKGRVSRLQERQLTHVSNNIFPIEINGTFDDCQLFVKKAFTDQTLAHLSFSTANSINIGRLIPQMIYYAYISTLLKEHKLHFVIPSGNMGNVSAAILAKRCGYPLHSFTIACNSNDTVVDFLSTGIYSPKKTTHTFSNAMDIGNPSNFERLLYLYTNKEAMLKDMSAISVTDEETSATIKKIFNNHNYLLDPHTAVAWKAAEKEKRGRHTIIVSTASPQKFQSEIKAHTGINQEDMTQAQPSRQNQRIYTCENVYDSLQQLLLKIMSD